MIIWDPLQQFPKEFGQELNCFEDDCYQSLKLLRWQDGYKEWYKPRSIHGIIGEVLIVAQILYCSNGHQITTRDARILSVIHNKLCIPFILLHKCWLRRDLSEIIFALATQGLSASPPSYPQCSFSSTSNDHLMDSFMSRYGEVKTYFASEMYLITGESCSCDHTFKLAKCVGIMRNGQWIPKYNFLFIIQEQMVSVNGSEFNSKQSCTTNLETHCSSIHLNLALSPQSYHP